MQGLRQKFVKGIVKAGDGCLNKRS